MMRPVLYALPPLTADSLDYSVAGNGNNTRLTLTWKDNSITETSYLVQKQAGAAGAWTTIGTIQAPLDPNPATPAIEPNTAGGTVSFVDTSVPLEQHHLQLPGRCPEHRRLRRCLPGHQR